MARKIDLAAWAAANLTVTEQAGEEWTCACPECGKEKLALNVSKQFWQCWTCKFSGRDPAKLIEATLGLSPSEVGAYLLTSTVSLATGRIEPLSAAKQTRGRLPLAPLPPGTGPLEGLPAAYAAERRIPPSHAEAFGLASVHGDGSGSLADRLLAGRLLIPAFDLARRLVYWQARATCADEIKTLNLPRSERHTKWGFPHTPDCAVRSEVLVGIHLIEPGDTVILVEGPIDAVVCGPGFVSSLGAALSPQQARLISATGASRVVILYDPDEAGERGARKAARQLSPYLQARIANCRPGLDPADMGRETSLSIVADYGGEIAPLLKK